METEVKERVLKGPIILERGCWGEAFRNAFFLPLLSSCPKAGCPSPPSLPGCFPSCSALLSLAAGAHTALPPSPQASLPREARGEGGTAPSHTNPEVSIFCHPLCHSRFLSHTRCFLCVWQLHPPRVTVGESGGMEELESP